MLRLTVAAHPTIELAVASALGLRARQVHIVSGATGRRKIVEVDVPGLEALRERLRLNEVRSD